jgi:hypothetical protein
MRAEQIAFPLRHAAPVAAGLVARFYAVVKWIARRGILDKLGPPPIAAKPLPAPKRYAPPRAKRRRVLTVR